MKNYSVLLLVSMLIIIHFYSFNIVLSENDKYFTPLTGMEEVPPVNTNSTGIALFDLLNNHLNFKVNVTMLENIKSAHIHVGEFGQNGEIIVSLLNSSSPINIHNGTLVKGQLTATDLVGSLKGKTINDLVKLFNNTKTYLNIHTKQYPNGEIRGQITTVNATNWWK
jgi:CHRD domain-containing protein